MHDHLNFQSRISQMHHKTEKSLKELVEEGEDVRLMLASDHIISAIKNQDPLLKSIFTPENTYTLISYLNQEHPLDPSNPDLSYKLPYMALEILNCECHILTQLLFEHEYRQGTLLLDYMLEFLDYQEHYLLAGYFSKAMIAITKRVFSPEHRYNQAICNRVFERGALDRCLNHLYSASINEIVMRWLTMKAKGNDYADKKRRFILRVVQLLNGDQQVTGEVKNFSPMSLESAIALIMLLLKSPLEPAPVQPQPIQHKNLNILTSKANQQELYGLVCNEGVISEIMKPIPNPSTQKITLALRIVEKYRSENEQLQQRGQAYNGQYLAQQITFQMLVQCLEWANQHILDLLEQHWNQQEQVAKNLPKTNLLATLQLLYELHLIPELTDALAFYYEEKQTEHVEGLVKLLKLKNNIVQNFLTKIMMIVLKKLKCPDFARTLLHQGISQLIDEPGIREHILNWARVILDTKAERGHIYENPLEEAQWDHMTEVIQNAEQIQIGNYRFKPAKLPIFYSTDKAKQVYSDFLQQPILIEYEIKDPDTPGLKKNMSGPAVLSLPKEQKKQIVPIKEAKEEEILKEDQVEIIEPSWLRAGYLSFNVDDLINQI